MAAALPAVAAAVASAVVQKALDDPPEEKLRPRPTDKDGNVVDAEWGMSKASDMLFGKSRKVLQSSDSSGGSQRNYARMGLGDATAPSGMMGAGVVNPGTEGSNGAGQGNPFALGAGKPANGIES